MWCLRYAYCTTSTSTSPNIHFIIILAFFLVKLLNNRVTEDLNSSTQVLVLVLVIVLV